MEYYLYKKTDIINSRQFRHKFILVIFRSCGCQIQFILLILSENGRSLKLSFFFD
jgi:hypothetical protein